LALFRTFDFFDGGAPWDCLPGIFVALGNIFWSNVFSEVYQNFDIDPVEILGRGRLTA
jgi:hypothetical protein